MVNTPATLDKGQCVGIQCSQREAKLLEKLRLIPFGQVTITMQDGQPVRIDKVREQEQL